jgi:hypothetical protein
LTPVLTPSQPAKFSPTPKIKEEVNPFNQLPPSNLATSQIYSEERIINPYSKVVKSRYPVKKPSQESPEPANKDID